MLEHVISLIKSLDKEVMEKCQFRLDNLTKPLGSLQSFEYLACKMAGITGNPKPRNLQKSIIIMAGSHEATTEGRSAMIEVFAEHVSAKFVLVDIGAAVDLASFYQVRHEKIAYGTKKIVRELAMTREQTIRAIEVGIKIAQEEIKKGSCVLGLGEMSSDDDTIASTAMIACYSNETVPELVGYNSEISDEFLSKKVQVIQTALAVNCPDKNDPLDVLSKVGGLEIAGLVGVILGAASGGAAVVLDGLATSAAALIAVKMAPMVKEYLVGSHFSVEPAHKVALDIISVPAYLHLDVGLGEGIGAALGMSLINASLHVLNDMKTFGEAEVAVAQDGPGALKQNQNAKN